jgi:hypothetical protein
MNNNSIKLPQTPGYYLWSILDFNYLEVGLVQVCQDNEKHIEYLRNRIISMRTKETKQFFLYQNDNGIWLTMYHQAYPHHLPTCNSDGVPWVDGYREVEFDWLLGDKS